MMINNNYSNNMRTNIIYKKKEYLRSTPEIPLKNPYHNTLLEKMINHVLSNK